MQGGYTRRRIKALSEHGRRMAAARWKRDRERREAEAPAVLRDLAEIDAINLPRSRGDVIGTLQWHDHRTGTVKRWTVEIGDRSDQVVLRAPDGRRTKSHGWTWVMDHLRGYLAGRK